MADVKRVVNLFAVGTGTGVDWRPWREGVDIHWVYGEASAGPAAALLRYAPGGKAPDHEHVGYEHVIVLSGSQEDEKGVYSRGTMVVNPPGSRHSVRAPGGCVVLVIWERPVRVLDDEAKGVAR